MSPDTANSESLTIRTSESHTIITGTAELIAALASVSARAIPDDGDNASGFTRRRFGLSLAL
jgi:hypothetical protein